MPVDAEIQCLLDALKGAPPMESLSVEALRASVPVPPLAARPKVRATEDVLIPGAPPIPARVYRPIELQSDGLVIFLHGGGFVVGSLETHDHVCRDLCRRAGIVVLAVDYRLAPEAKFPAAVDDSLNAARWALRNAVGLSVNQGNIIIAGDSAGGNLAAVTAIRLRDEGEPLRGQLLIYPVTDYHTPGTASYFEHASGYSLTRAAMIRFWREYLANEEGATHVYAAPLRASDLGNLPPAFVMTAELDPLRDEGEAFARRLADAGVAVMLKRYDGMIHGFFRMAPVSERASAAIDDAVAWMHQVLR